MCIGFILVRLNLNGLVVDTIVVFGEILVEKVYTTKQKQIKFQPIVINVVVNHLCLLVD